MSKKEDLLAKAQELGLEVTEKNTIVQIEEALASADQPAKEQTTEEAPQLAKAGKRSAKAVKEAAEKTEKEERKAKIAAGEIDEEAGTKKGPKPNTRPKLQRRSKKYQEVFGLIEKDKLYKLEEAIELLPKLNSAKFIGSAELHIKLGVDPKQADQNIRGTVSLPNGTGKEVRVAVFCPADQVASAKEAGADLAGEEELLEALNKEEINFDVLIATPQLMVKLSKYARLLGPRGLMPNPKTGTVAADVAKATKEAKAGKVEYRVDKQGIVHLAAGKLNFSAKDLTENIQTIIRAIKEAKPSGLKGEYIQSIFLAPSMGPGIKLEL
jgi:large subunit ribosomal protein L1